MITYLEQSPNVPMQQMPALKWMRRCRMWLDGVDVTADAYFAYAPVLSGAEAPGKVWLYKRNEDGYRYLEAGEAASEVRCGMVRWEHIW